MPPQFSFVVPSLYDSWFSLHYSSLHHSSHSILRASLVPSLYDSWFSHNTVCELQSKAKYLMGTWDYSSIYHSSHSIFCCSHLAPDGHRLPPLCHLPWDQHKGEERAATPAPLGAIPLDPPLPLPSSPQEGPSLPPSFGPPPLPTIPGPGPRLGALDQAEDYLGPQTPQPNGMHRRLSSAPSLPPPPLGPELGRI